MPDNNPALRATIARHAAGVFAWQFTSDFEIGGVIASACISQLDEADKLEIAGRDILRALNVSCLIHTTTISTGVTVKGLDNAKYTEGDPVVLDGDPKWQIKRWADSPDGAVRTFTLLDGN